MFVHYAANSGLKKQLCISYLSVIVIYRVVLTRLLTTHNPCSNTINSTRFNIWHSRQGLFWHFCNVRIFPKSEKFDWKANLPIYGKMKGILQEVGRGVQFWRANSMTYVLMCHVKSLILLPTKYSLIHEKMSKFTDTTMLQADSSKFKTFTTKH